MRPRILAASVIAATGIVTFAPAQDNPHPPAEPSLLKSILKLNWPDVEAERAALRQRILDAQPEPNLDPVDAWIWLSWRSLRVQGHLLGAIDSSVSVQEWIAQNPDRHDCYLFLYECPAELRDEHARILASVFNSEEWSELLEMAEEPAFIAPWGPTTDRIVGHTPFDSRTALNGLLKHAANAHDFEHLNECVSAIFAVARAEQSNGDFISMVVAYNGTGRVFDHAISLSRAARPEWDDDLRKLAELIHAYKPLPPEVWIDGEHIYMHEYFMKLYGDLRNTEADLAAWIAEHGEDSIKEFEARLNATLREMSQDDVFGLTLIPSPSLELESINQLNNLVQIALGDDPDAARDARSQIEKISNEDFEDENWTAKRPVVAMTSMSWPPAIRSSLLTYAHRDAALTSIALARYRIANKSYPDSLEDLIPKYLDTPPIDSFDGQPLRYRLVENDWGHQDYVLYSVGCDDVDDGGIVHPSHWSRAATVSRRKADNGTGYDIVFTAIDPD